MMNVQILRFAAPTEEPPVKSPLSNLDDLRISDLDLTKPPLSLFSGDGLPGEIPQRSRATLTEALSIYMSFEDNLPLSEIARMTDNIHAYGIGHLLHCGLKKNLIKDDMSAADILDRVYRADMAHPQETQINRHRVVYWLKKIGLVVGRASDRQLKPAGTTPCVKSLISLVSDRTKVPFDVITSDSRMRDVVKARFQAIWLLRMVCGHPLATIGQNMGNRDHTTILNAVNKMQLNIQTDDGFRQSMKYLCEQADTIGIIQNRNLLLRATQHLN
ncbi:hypothetical protein KUV57_13005 [Epibacterium sp. DP7N7-1]|nr:hypothetical protein [Epibacterium sp. DP7N7-1]